MTEIKLIVNGADASASVSGPITAGAVGIPVQVEFDDSWSGLTPVLFCSGWRGETPMLIHEDGTSVLPPEQLKGGELLRIGVRGVNVDTGDLIVPTVWVSLGRILPSPGSCPLPDPAPGIAEQTLAAARNAEAAAQKAKDDADQAREDADEAIAAMVETGGLVDQAKAAANEAGSLALRAAGEAAKAQDFSSRASASAGNAMIQAEKASGFADKAKEHADDSLKFSSMAESASRTAGQQANIAQQYAGEASGHADAARIASASASASATYAADRASAAAASEQNAMASEQNASSHAETAERAKADANKAADAANRYSEASAESAAQAETIQGEIQRDYPLVPSLAAELNSRTANETQNLEWINGQWSIKSWKVINDSGSANPTDKHIVHTNATDIDVHDVDSVFFNVDDGEPFRLYAYGSVDGKTGEQISLGSSGFTRLSSGYIDVTGYNFLHIVFGFDPVSTILPEQGDRVTMTKIGNIVRDIDDLRKNNNELREYAEELFGMSVRSAGQLKDATTLADVRDMEGNTVLYIPAAFTVDVRNMPKRVSSGGFTVTKLIPVKGKNNLTAVYIAVHSPAAKTIAETYIAREYNADDGLVWSKLADNSEISKLILNGVTEYRDWEPGSIKTTDGSNPSTTDERYRRTDYIPVDFVSLSINSAANPYIFRYDHNKDFIGYSRGNTLDNPGCEYIRVAVMDADTPNLSISLYGVLGKIAESQVIPKPEAQSREAYEQCLGTALDKPFDFSKMILFGDSLTTYSHGRPYYDTSERRTAYMKWASVFAENVGGSVINRGIGSTAFVVNNTGKIIEQINSVTDDQWKQATVVVIAAGINDAAYIKSSPSKLEQLRGEIINCYETIRSHTDAKVIFITPLRCGEGKPSEGERDAFMVAKVAAIICNTALFLGASVLNGFTCPIAYHGLSYDYDATSNRVNAINDENGKYVNVPNDYKKPDDHSDNHVFIPNQDEAERMGKVILQNATGVGDIVNMTRDGLHPEGVAKLIYERWFRGNVL